MEGLDLRFRVPSTDLLLLPWLEPLEQWDATVVPIRDVPVGPSRHLVRFVEADRALWALKVLPLSVATREYDVLRDLEERSLPAVRPAGVVVQPFPDTAILLTRYLEGSWQYRRLFMRVPVTMVKHRARLFDAMAALLVDLHRNGVYWGDCSLANTLFKRDGQLLQAWLVDAETSAIHPSLSDGQRIDDLEIMVENVAGGLLDVAARLEEPPEDNESLFEEALSLRRRYEALWDVLQEQPLVRLGDRHEVEARLRRLNDLGYVVDEVRLVSGETGDDQLRLQVAVAERGFHAAELRRIAGLDVGEGQAVVLLNDLQAYRTRLAAAGMEVSEGEAAHRWVHEVLEPGMAKAHEALGGVGDPVQAYCDLLEVRWLLSELAGHDVGDEPALETLRRRAAPLESAAAMGVAELATQEVPVVGRREPPELGGL